jgi:glutamate racemase
LVVACNTASSAALKDLRKFLTIPVIGMIEPGAKTALRESKHGKVGVIGTRATINNKAYAHELKKLNPKVKVFEQACPLFVPIAEEGWLEHKVTELIAKEYLNELKNKKVDSLILGCTHYPILHNVIQKAVGKSVKLIDSGTPAAKLVEEYLNARGLRNISNQMGQSEFYVSDVPVTFKEIAQRFLGKKITHLHKVELDELVND